MIEHYGSMDLLGYAIHMMKLITILSVLAVVSMAADKSADAVKAAEKAWASATGAGDEATLKQILADALTDTRSTGDTDKKTATIRNLKGARKHHKLNH